MFNPLDILRAPFRRDKLGMTPTDWFSLWLRRDALLTKLGSRKLWAAVASAGWATFAAQLGMPESVNLAVLGIIATYIGGQSYVDGKAAAAAKGNN